MPPQDAAKPKSAADQTTQEKAASAEPSGPKGDNPATAGAGETKVQSDTPENRLGHLNPSAPEDSNTTPGSMDQKSVGEK